MGDRSYFVAFWTLWILAIVCLFADEAIVALWLLGNAILFRLFWQESRD